MLFMLLKVGQDVHYIYEIVFIKWYLNRQQNRNLSDAGNTFAILFINGILYTKRVSLVALSFWIEDFYKQF